MTEPKFPRNSELIGDKGQASQPLVRFLDQVKSRAYSAIQSFNEFFSLSTISEAVDPANDYLLIYNASDAVAQKVSPSVLFSGAQGFVAYSDDFTTRTAIGTSDTTFFTINVSNMPQNGILLTTIGLLYDNTIGSSRDITSGITIGSTTEYGFWGNIGRWSVAAPLLTDGEVVETQLIDINLLRTRMGGAFTTGPVTIDIHYRASGSGVFVDGATMPAKATIAILSTD